jgi:hypothetical protein
MGIEEDDLRPEELERGWIGSGRLEGWKAVVLVVRKERRGCCRWR